MWPPCFITASRAVTPDIRCTHASTSSGLRRLDAYRSRRPIS
ncbi:MAG: hypothetical protein ACI8PZ_003843 [Myxococcota bacterium]|jgi:hypothetical protein